MLVKKMESVRNLAKKVKEFKGGCWKPQYECLINDESDESTAMTATGFLAVYVGEERQRFVVPLVFLSHPLFKMLLDKAYQEYGFEQKSGLVVPCAVSVFKEVVSAVECCHGQFHMEKLLQEFL